MKEVLMCPPTAFDISYSINPWMDISNKPDKKLAFLQWQNLYETYQKLGVKVNLIEQKEDLPDMVFTANAGIVHNNNFISANYVNKERKPEEKHFQDWFQNNGYNLKKLAYHQGGEGDALFYLDKYYCGYGFRSELRSHNELKDILNTPVESLKIIDPHFYDFDLAFCPLGNKSALYYPNAFDENSQTILEKIPNGICISSEQARKHLCNSVYIDNKLFVGQYDQKLEESLNSLGIDMCVIDISEFRKAGGGIKCLTLKIS